MIKAQKENINNLDGETLEIRRKRRMREKRREKRCSCLYLDPESLLESSPDHTIHIYATYHDFPMRSVTRGIKGARLYQNGQSSANGTKGIESPCVIQREVLPDLPPENRTQFDKLVGSSIQRSAVDLS